MYRKYYSYNDMPRLSPKSSAASSAPCEAPQLPQKTEKGIQTDDIILGIIILAILLDDSNDNLLLLALAVIFLAGGT